MLARIRGLDGIRGIAATAVLLQHTVQINGDIAAISVYAFFVLSGFLITGILHRSRAATESGKSAFHDELTDFWRKRVLRLCPLYFVSLAFAVAIDLWLRDGALLRALPWYVAYLQNYQIGFSGTWGTFTHTWTLAIEQQFYLLFSLVLLLVPARLHLHAVCAVILFGIVSLWALWGVVSPFALWLLPQWGLLFLGAGGLLALSGYRLPGAACGPAAMLAVLAIGWQLWSHPLYGELFIALLLASLSTLVLAVVSSQSSILTTALDVAPLRGLGVISYGLYIIHVPVMFLIAAFVPLSPLGLFVVVFTLSVALASASWRWLEKPLMRRSPSLRRPAIAGDLYTSAARIVKDNAGG